MVDDTIKGRKPGRDSFAQQREQRIVVGTETRTRLDCAAA